MGNKVDRNRRHSVTSITQNLPTAERVGKYYEDKIPKAPVKLIDHHAKVHSIVAKFI